MQGERLAHYEVLRPLGRGGMGEVWVARDNRLNREVALKLLPPELAEDAERLSRFEREAKTLAALNHPNIVTIYSVEEADGRRFMTMELVPGTPLGERIPEGGLPAAELVDLAVPLAQGLAAAHARGVQHRDLKPANVMVTDEGRVKILDFGLAQVREQPQAANSTMTEMLTGEFSDEGKIMGTIPYMSPEQAEGRPLDHRSDIFSLGILLYEMTTGKRPFDGESSLSTLTAILRDEPDSISDIRDNIPLPLARVIQRALEKRPEDRYQSTTDMARDLADIKRDMDTGEALATGLYSGLHAKPEIPPARSPRSVLLALAAVVALMAVVALVLSLVASRRDAAAPVGFEAIPTRADLPGIVVLYFDNISDDPDLEWLRTGLTDMLVTDLSQATNLRVVGTDRLYTLLADMGNLADRNTSFEVVQELARRARVGTAVVGSYARAGDQIRINARVQDAGSGDVLASESVSGDTDELFTLVDDLTSRITANFEMPAMSTEMTAAMDDAGMGDRELRSVTTDSVDAYKLYNEAEMLKMESREEEAIPLLVRAVELDPDFAMAHAKLSVLYTNTGDHPAGFATAETAFRMSDKLPPRERYYIQGRFYSLRNETLQQAIDAYGKLLELFPFHTAARNNLAIVLQELERYEEAIGHFEALREQGDNFAGLYSNLAGLYQTLGRYEDAVVVMQEFVDDNPQIAAARLNLAQALTRADRTDEALVELERAEALGIGAVTHEIRAAYAATVDDWEEFDVQVDALLATDAPNLRLQGYTLRATRALQFGRLAEFETTLDLAERQFNDSRLLARVLMIRSGTAQQLDDPEKALEINARLAAIDDPTGNFAQSIAVTDLLANAALGRREEAYAARDAFWELISSVPAPERLRERVRHQIDGALAWAERDPERTVTELQAAIALMPPSKTADGWADVHYYLASSLWELGRHDEAAAIFRQLRDLTLERVNTPVLWVRSHWYLGQYHADRGEDAAAREHFDRFLYYWGDGEIDGDRVATAREYLQ